MVSLKTSSARSSRPRTTSPQPMNSPASAMGNLLCWGPADSAAQPTSAAERAGDHQLLDLVRSLADGEDLRVAIEAADGVLLDVAVAAVDLHRLLGRAHRQPARLELGLRRGEREVAAGVLEQRRL